MDYRIINASHAYLDGLEHLEQQCFTDPWTREQLSASFPDEHHAFLLAVDSQDNVLGYVAMIYVLDEGSISNVAVDSRFRKQGIGDALLIAMLENARRLSLSFVTLEVRESNDAAISLYAKRGFVPVGKRKNYYEHPKEDAVLMSLYL